MKTIAQQMNAKTFPFRMFDKNGNKIYCEISDNYWYRQEFNLNNQQTSYVDSKEYWGKWEYDKTGKQIYFENSDGLIRDDRPVREVTMQEVEAQFGCTVKIKK